MYSKNINRFVIVLLMGVLSACGGSGGGSSSSGGNSSSSSSSSSSGNPSNEIKGDPNAIVDTIVEDLNGPDAVVLLNSGSLYVSEYGDGADAGNGSAIREYSVSGSLFDSIEGLRGPLGMAINSQGTLYFTHDRAAGEGYIFKYDDGGEPERIATIPGWPAGLAVDAEDNIYVTNYSQNNLYRISPAGERTLVSSDDRLSGSVGIVYAQGSLWLANYNNGRILNVQLSGEVSEVVAANSQSGMGIGYITYYNEKLYATDISRHLVLEVTLDGDISVLAGTTVVGNNDGGGDVATFNMPNGITVDSDLGILYLSEYNGGLRSIQLP